MGKATREATVSVSGGLGTSLEAHLRGMLGHLIRELLEAELRQALGNSSYERTETRRGYRHGTRPRSLTTSLGTAAVEVPRARLFNDSQAKEWRSQVLPRYARRTEVVDAAVVQAYLSGTNQRRVRVALAPLLGGEHLSRSAVTRVLDRLRGGFKEWQSRSLGDRVFPYLFLDGIVVKVRVGRHVEQLPVLVALGVGVDGHKELVALQLMSSESKAAWGDFVDDLARRGLAQPALCIIDGNAGLRHAIGRSWPQTKVQRCVVHKLRNLEAHCPKRLIGELRATFHAITLASSGASAHKAYKSFIKRWEKVAPGVARSLAEAGEELLTFYEFPATQWKCLRTTNAIERLHLEFRRRIKTQCSLPSETSLLSLMYGLYESGQIRMRRIDGWDKLPSVVARWHARQLAASEAAA